MSGELQGSVIVERRGNPQTYGELVDYLRCAIRVLQSMVGDPDSGVGEVAEKAAIHPILETEAVRDTLFEALASLPDDALRKVQTEIKHRYALFANVEKPKYWGRDEVRARRRWPSSRTRCTASSGRTCRGAGFADLYTPKPER
ncbi:hypothetical protein TM48_02008 [Mycobacterium shottsii]|uniref:Uncharacterized protein n=1 Tax=Mycobacterium shottsii TaxID=133549 RepID=A0A7I7LD56_9MYCO|nr:hypothetical protein [Mycobacterium shottsii]QYL27756.1 hypothetical protein TM48_02008 [Mycobacterium shottsii]BBX57570.1 hypothetical protein MSHO_29150 [Mycobacterium shottsii]